MSKNQTGVDPDKESPAPRGPLGDALPGREKADPRTSGGQSQEKVEDRPVVGQVKPEDYPEEDRRLSKP